ncbi:hypothetical protein TNCV_59191 [Trichonephila clavipes]|nr:hypothetical protein TNCV_59191 [Trichonephila clavipes]
MLSDWRTRWGPRVSESPVEEWKICSPYFTYSTDAGSPTRVFVFSLFQDIKPWLFQETSEEHNPMNIVRKQTSLIALNLDFLIRAFLVHGEDSLFQCMNRRFVSGSQVKQRNNFYSNEDYDYTNLLTETRGTASERGITLNISDSDEDIRLSESDCKKSEKSADGIENPNIYVARNGT